jgi:predicted Zn-dependent protease
MTQRRFFVLTLALLSLLLASCGPEAKKKRAMEGGDKYFEKGQYKQARLMYLNAVKADPRFGDAYYKLAQTNLRLGNISEAAGNLQRTIELVPENIDAHGKLADIYLSAYAANPSKFKNLLVEIRELSTRMEKRAKGSYEELRLRGYIALADEKVPEALEIFRQADKVKPGQQMLQLTIARTLILLKQVDEAKAYIRAAVDKDKTFSGGYDILYALAAANKNLEEGEKILIERSQASPKDVNNRLRLAAHYVGAQKLDQAEIVLKDIIAKRSEFANAYLNVGDFYYRLRNFDRAAETYLEGARNDSTRSRDYEKRLIEVRVAQNRSPEALEICEKILREDKNDAEAIAMRASLWLYAGKPEQINSAIAELQSVIAKMPDNFVLRYNLGRALMSKGDADGARVQFADAVKLRPDYLPARLALAQIQISRNEYAAALSAANEILQADPNNQYARLIRARAFLAQNKFSESRSALEETLRINPAQRDAKYQLGFVNFKEGKLKEAEAIFQEIYNLDPPDIRGLLGLTEVYVAQKQNDRALKLIEEAKAKFPKATGLDVAWGNIAIRSGKFDEAISVLGKVLAADPGNFDIHMRLAEAYRQKGDLAKATEIWKKANEIMPNQMQPVLSRALALEQLNRRSEAAPLYEQILKAEPDNVVALNNYSFFLADQGNNLDQALSLAQKARSKAPNDPMIADTLGFIYLKKNLPENAASIFTELTGKYPGVALFHIRLANAYLQAGNKTKAKQELEEARKNKPSKSDLDEIQKLAARLG